MTREGNILLWRSLTESAVWEDPPLLKVWIWCLFRANYQDRQVGITVGRGIQVIQVKRGQFVTGRKSAASDLKMPESSIRNRLDRLKELGNVDMKVDSHYTLITVVNYDTYQSIEKGSGQKSGQAKDRQRTGKGQAKDTEIPVIPDITDKPILSPDVEDDGNAFANDEEKLFPDGTPPAQEKPAKVRDDIWDTVAELFFSSGVPNDRKTAVGKVVKGLKERKATASQIRTRVNRMRESFKPEYPVTMHSLLNNWESYSDEAWEDRKDREIDAYVNG